MADVALRLTENAQGKFFVDSTCIACEACVLVAPEYFSMLPGLPLLVKTTDSPDIVVADALVLRKSIGKAYVHCQPQNNQEQIQLRDAMSICPTDSIGEITP